MEDLYARTALLVGEEGVRRLQAAHVAVFGLGGVGGAAVTALARAGVGALTLVDDDQVMPTNLNRQEVAWHSTLGRAKTQAMAAMVAEINPQCRVQCRRLFFLPENAGEIDFSGFDFVLDAVDTVTAKLEIIARSRAAGVPVVSVMGAGNKLYPECFRLADLEKTSVCPLARVMRKECRKRGLSGVKAVYSTEEPLAPLAVAGPEEAAPAGRKGKPKETSPGSISFVPAAAGLVAAGAVVRGLLGLE